MPHSSHHAMHSAAFSDWLPVSLVVVLALAYGYGLLRLHRNHRPWPIWRVGSFLSGLGLLATAMLPSLMHWAHQDLRGHMVQHLLLGMFGPLLLVLGAPIMLALLAMPARLARGATAVLRSRVFAGLSHPSTTLLLNIGGMYVLYLTPLYRLTLSTPALHYLVHVHFLLAGCLFVWAMIGPEPVPHRPSFAVRVAVLFVGIAAHAFLSKLMYAYGYPLHSPHSLGEIRAAAKLMYYWGDLSELLLAIVLFGLWYRRRGRESGSLAVQPAA